MSIYRIGCISCRKFVGKEVRRAILKNEYCKLILREDDQNKWFGRAIAVPLKHMNPFEKMSKENRECTIACLEMLDRYACTLRRNFGVTNINILQIGNLTRDEEGNPTANPLYQHVHWHILPRCGREDGKGGS
jgi:diadenosine tetraphosphate (Ap4A) HIT family hydrolase